MEEKSGGLECLLFHDLLLNCTEVPLFSKVCPRMCFYSLETLWFGHETVKMFGLGMFLLKDLNSDLSVLGVVVPEQNPNRYLSLTVQENTASLGDYSVLCEADPSFKESAAVRCSLCLKWETSVDCCRSAWLTFSGEM